MTLKGCASLEALASFLRGAARNKTPVIVWFVIGAPDP
jgi:hypothetical protein